MKKIITLVFCLIVTVSSINAQNASYEDICKTNKIYFFGYDFTNFKLIEPKRVGNDQKMKIFIFEVIRVMNDRRDNINYSKLLKKDSVIFVQNTVNDLNSKIKREDLLGSENDFIKHSIKQDSLQYMVNRYSTQGMTGIGFVQIIECFYKPKKETTIWYVFFDIASKKILDSYETSNNDADSYHGLSEYWAVGVNSGLGPFLSDHYSKIRKVCKKK